MGCYCPICTVERIQRGLPINPDEMRKAGVPEPVIVLAEAMARRHDGSDRQRDRREAEQIEPPRPVFFPPRRSRGGPNPFIDIKLLPVGQIEPITAIAVDPATVDGADDKEEEPMPETKPQVKLDDKWKDVRVAREGAQIVLPEGMSFDEGIAWLGRRRDEDEQVVSVREEIEGFPLDAGIAVVKALQKAKGFVSITGSPGFFGDNPPKMITVETGVGETTQVPWGRMQIPGVSGFLQPSFGVKDGRLMLVVGGEVKQRDRAEIAALMQLARTILRDESIYKGKAIRVRFQRPGEDLSPTHAPKFIDVRDVRERELVFPEAVRKQVQTSLFTPVERTEACRRAGIPLKRGVLLSGPYGVGKSLTANVMAKKCQENGWTFIYLDSVVDLAAGIMFAQAYQPACIFAEDIDRAVSGDRSVDMDTILNTIDGIDTKRSELMVILTTNNVEKIHRAMLRPGRLDAVITIGPPDARAASELVRIYARDLLRAGEDLAAVGEALAGKIPAVIREVVERAKLVAVGREDFADTIELQAVDLLTAAEGMNAHLELMAADANEEPSDDLELFARVLGETVREDLRDNLTYARNRQAEQRTNGAAQG